MNQIFCRCRKCLSHFLKPEGKCGKVSFNGTDVCDECYEYVDYRIHNWKNVGT